MRHLLVLTAVGLVLAACSGRERRPITPTLPGSRTATQVGGLDGESRTPPATSVTPGASDWTETKTDTSTSTDTDTSVSTSTSTDTTASTSTGGASLPDLPGNLPDWDGTSFGGNDTFDITPVP